MKLQIPIIFLLIVGFSSYSFASKSGREVIALSLGEKIFDNNCNSVFTKEEKNLSRCGSQSLSTHSWYSFRTPTEKRTVDLRFREMGMGDNYRIALYKEFEGQQVWSECDYKQLDNEMVSFRSLLEDHQYYIQVSSDLQSEGEYELVVLENLLSPPINDDCVNAIELFGGEAECGSFTQVFEDPCATPDAEATGNCVDPTDPAVWYTFTTPDPLPFNSVWHGLSPSSFEVFSTTSDCSGLVYEDCGGVTYIHFEPGTTYYYLNHDGMVFSIYELSIPNDCGSPFPYIDTGPGISTAWGDTECASPSNAVLCQNEHVIWFSYTTGCGDSDLTISVEQFTTNLGSLPAEDLSISAFELDCNTILDDFDPNGAGYVCSAITSGAVLEMENVPPGTSMVIAIGSAANEVGNFMVTMDEINSGALSNDLCVDAQFVDEGVNPNLSNLCASPDVSIPGCSSQSEATIWFEYDPGPDPVDVTISVIENGISNPAIGALADCSGIFLGMSCSETLELSCINEPIMILVGSSDFGAGQFDLDISSSPASTPPIPDYTNLPICSNDPAGIIIDFPSGDIVDVLVELSSSSSSNIDGAMSQSFNDVSQFTINDILDNNSNIPEEVVYELIISGNGFSCPADPILVPILVYPQFDPVDYIIESCAPYDLFLDANTLFTGGIGPFNYNWLWNGTDDLGSDQIVDTELFDSGFLTLLVTDDMGCDFNTTVDVDLSVTATASFDFPLLYCRSDQDIIFFDDTSIEGIEGTWSPPIIELEFFTDGLYDIVFTPNDIQCLTGVQYEIEIYSGDELDFDLPALVCSNEENYTFPTTDDDGIEGTWLFPTMDLSVLSGIQSNVFTPNSFDCYEVFEYEFEVSGAITPIFALDALCSNQGIIVMDPISIDGYEGLWDPASFDASTSGSSIVLNWTPLPGQSDCLSEAEYIVNINDAEIPNFTLPLELCQSAAILNLPNLSNENISGTWSVPNIDPSAQSGMVTSIFTPDFGQCAESFTYEIEIIEDSAPEFTLVSELCELDLMLDLPLVAENGISGNWNIPTINPLGLGGQQVALTFTPDPSWTCAATFEWVIDVQFVQEVDFDLPNYLCWDDSDFLLPQASLNNILGAWSATSIEVSSNPGQTLSYSFVPLADQCAAEYMYQVQISEPINLSLQEVNPTSCTEDNGELIIVGDTTDKEFSIDGGVAWQSLPLFDELPSGVFNILIRSTSFTDCEESVTGNLASVDAPNIINITVGDISNCISDNGTITIEADGNNLQYSINGGLNWFDDFSFDELAPGPYTVAVVDPDALDCIVSSDITIQDIIPVEIIDFSTEDISDCNLTDGLINIEATGENLQYSIDGGATWSDNPIFSNLPSGEYDLMIQSTVSMDCVDSAQAILSAPGEPSIDFVNFMAPSYCEPNAGQISIMATGSNLQFSIDGGDSWQEDPVFDDLPFGEYDLLIQNMLQTNCTDGQIYELEVIMDELPEAMIEIGPLSDCNTSDGSIEIISLETNIAYSIDGGLTWSNSPIFNGLSSGTYDVVIRKIDAPDCLSSQMVTIEIPDCPCPDLIVSADISNTDCNSIGGAVIDILSVEGMENPSYQLQWADGTDFTSVDGLDSGTYELTILYDDDCTWVETFEVELEEAINFELVTIDSDCEESANGSIQIINITGGNGQYAYSLDGGEFQALPTFEGLQDGVYTLTVTDSMGCTSEEQKTISNIYQLNASLPEIVLLTSGETLLLDPGFNEAEVDSFFWNDDVSFLNPGEWLAEVSPSQSTSYSLTIFYGACIEVLMTQVDIIETVGIFIPNIFSPDGDGTNDQLYIHSNSNALLNNFEVYDRWGNLMYNIQSPQANVPGDGWDGTFNGSKVNPGVYVYKLEYTSGQEIERKVGTVTIIE